MVGEISLVLPNTAGQFATALKVLADADVNVLAFSIDQAGKYSIIRLICNPHDRACKQFEEHGFGVQTDSIFAILLPQRPGALQPIAEMFGKHEINIEYGYLTYRAGTDKAVVLLKTDNVENAKKLLAAQKYQDLSEI